MQGNNEKAIRTVALAGNDETEMLRLFEELTAAPICELPKNGAKGYYYYKYRKYELTAFFGKFTNESVKDFDTVVFILPAVKIEREITDAFICARSCKSAVILLTDYKRAKKTGKKINARLLSRALKAPIIKSTPYSGRGANKLLEEIHKRS